MTTHSQNTDWQLALHNPNYPGQQAAGVDDINQCLVIILNTPLGSDPLRPLFGCDMLPWLDQPENIAIPNMMLVTRHAIKRWEKRIVLERIVPTRNADGWWVLQLFWRFLQGTQTNQLEVHYVA